MVNKASLFFIGIFFGILSIAQIPTGYYDSAQGLEGEALRTALHDIIDNHQVISYNALHSYFDETDKKSNGKVWDMYSDIPGGTPAYEFSFGNTCGNYQEEGDCYNREHSWPKSWFNDASPMYSDLFHLYPTDGYVNGRRSNYPFGEVGLVTWVSENGSKVGVSDYPGIGGTVFEPIDEYKGDFARTYFYMSVRYYNEDQGWYSNELVDGADIKPAGINMLLEWHYADPVSQKEIDRNNAVFDIQHNRNPFIDNPNYANLIYGDPNLAPYFVSTPQTIAYVNQEYTYNIEAEDPENDNLSFSTPFGSIPAWMDFIDNNDGTAQLIGTPTGTQENIEMTIWVTDNVNGHISQEFSINVLTSIKSIPNNKCYNFVYTKNQISINFIDEHTDKFITIYNSNGKKMLSTSNSGKKKFIFRTTTFKPGMYYLIINSNNTLYYEKFVNL